MPSPDDELRTRFHRTIGDEPGDGLFGELARRRERRRAARRVGVVGLAAVVILVSVGGYLALSRTFRTDVPVGPLVVTPAPTEVPSIVTTPSPTPPSADPTPAPLACRDRAVQGAFDHVSGLDTASVTCVAGRWSLAVDWSSGASGTWSLADCDLGCAPFAAPDLNGDGIAELLVFFRSDVPGGSGGFVAVFDLTASEAAGTALTPKYGSESYGTFNLGRLVVGTGVNQTHALTCEAGRLVWLSGVRQGDGNWLVDRWTIDVHTSAGNGDRHLVLADQATSTQPGPVHQLATLCGAPVLLAPETGDPI